MSAGNPANDHADATSSPDDLAPVLTVDEVADLLRVDRKSIYEVIRRGELPGVRRLGRSIRVHRDTVLRWIAEGQGRAPRSRGNR